MRPGSASRRCAGSCSPTTSSRTSASRSCGTDITDEVRSSRVRTPRNLRFRGDPAMVAHVAVGAMKFGVVVFPGTWSDRDCGWVVDQVVGAELVYLWHKDTDLKGCDCVILPGGFAYGDYL